MIDISIIILSFNTKDLLKDCIRSIISNTKKIKFEIIVVDNGSKDGSVLEVERLKKQNPKKTIHLLKNKKNLGFAKANNQGIKKAKGKYLLLLNSDTLLRANVLDEMLPWMENNPEIGIASCALLNKDKSMQGTGGYFPTLLRVFSWMIIQDLPFVDNIIKPFHPMHHKSFRKKEAFYNNKRELDWVTGAFFLMKRQVHEDIGLLDEDYFMYTEEVDYCYRAKKAGWKIFYNPKWSIIHCGGASGAAGLYVILEFEGVKLFYKKHYPLWHYPLLRLLLKIGALGRVVVFGILEGRESAKVYVKAFRKA